jgi:hypothetical protein
MYWIERDNLLNALKSAKTLDEVKEVIRQFIETIEIENDPYDE